MTSISRQDLENAAALIATAIGLIRQAEPVMRRALDERQNADFAAHAVNVLMRPVFRAAAELVRVHDAQMGLVQAALEKVNHG